MGGLLELVVDEDGRYMILFPTVIVLGQKLSRKKSCTTLDVT